jgi:3-hydroxyisobutyrate dehydrogenase
MHIGFIGLGHLGSAISGRLVTSGHELSVYNRTPGKAPELEAERLSSPKEVAQACETIMICLFDSRAVDAVLNGENGLLSGDVAGKTIIDLSTNHFEDVERFHTLCRAAGVDYLECPVLGSVVPATNGALTVLISGDKSVFERSRGVLENIGTQLFYLEIPAKATKVKLLNHLALGSIMATLAETVSLGEAAGIGKEELLDILSVGGGKSLVLDVKKQKLLDEDFSVHFSSALIYKDLHCLQDLAFSLKQPLYGASLVKELYARTFMEGIENEDFSAVYKLFKKETS